MKLVVVSFGGIYYIGINRDHWGVETYDNFIIKTLKIDKKDYIKILYHSGAIENYDNYYFDEYENCQKAIAELEPYLVMAKLIGE